MAEIQREERARLMVDVRNIDQLAAFVASLREADIIGKDIEAVQYTDADSAEACGIAAANVFVVVPEVRPEHGPSLMSLLPPPPAEFDVPPAPETDHPAETGLSPATGAAPF